MFIHFKFQNKLYNMYLRNANHYKQFVNDINGQWNYNS